jgi:hypothetical protein
LFLTTKQTKMCIADSHRLSHEMCLVFFYISFFACWDKSSLQSTKTGTVLQWFQSLNYYRNIKDQHNKRICVTKLHTPCHIVRCSSFLFFSFPTCWGKSYLYSRKTAIVLQRFES